MADTDSILVYLCNDQVESKLKNTLATYDRFFNRSFDMKLKPH